MVITFIPRNFHNGTIKKAFGWSSIKTTLFTFQHRRQSCHTQDTKDRRSRQDKTLQTWQNSKWRRSDYILQRTYLVMNWNSWICQRMYKVFFIEIYLFKAKWLVCGCYHLPGQGDQYSFTHLGNAFHNTPKILERFLLAGEFNAKYFKPCYQSFFFMTIIQRI